MTLNLDNPAMFMPGGLVKINEDYTTTSLGIRGKSTDAMRLITEPIDLIPGPNDVFKEVMHLEPGDILLTFTDWTLSSEMKYYRIVFRNDQAKEYLEKWTAYLKETESKKNSELKRNESGCKSCPDPSF